MEHQGSQLSKTRPGRRMCEGNDREEPEGGKQGDRFFLREIEAKVKDRFKEIITNNVKYLREAE